MKTALVLMTILGCDDAAVQCHYVEAVDRQWTSIQACEADSESNLDRFMHLDFPVVVAVCESTATSAVPDNPAESTVAQMPAGDGIRRPSVDIPAANGQSATGQENPAATNAPPLTGRVRRTIDRALPSLADAKALAAKPVHFVTDTYAWVAKRVRRGTVKD